jgi:gliding motility-associated-like protein
MTLKRLLLIAFVVLSYTGLRAQQQILLLTETFETPNSNPVNVDSGGVGTNTGNNAWIINDEFNGQPTYINTPPQDSVVSGTINGAPFSNYLHIHDQSAAPGIANSNWNSSTQSDRFVTLSRTFCTLGMTDVIVTFFWLCEGNNDAYGQVYYRANGGAWTPVGQPKYNNQNKWKYEILQSPAFNGVQDLEIGFRWINNTGGSSNLSFSIDDIIAVGTLNPPPVGTPSLDIGAIQNNICQGDPFAVPFTINLQACNPTFKIEMYDANNNLVDVNANNTNFDPFLSIATGDITTVPFTSAFGLDPNVLAPGNCFRIVMTMIAPFPGAVIDTSLCFSIIDCPESIFNLSAAVLNDIDTPCVKSAIDIKFNSLGFYNPGNNYIAELSDTNGSFAAPFFIGQLGSSNSYPAIPQGTVSGLLPQNAPPGCGYYIRIRSTSPAAISSPLLGPFCLTQCDVTTNLTQDLHFCIESGPHPQDTTFVITINQWNTQANYDTCNDWRIELHNMMTFATVNVGGLGIYHDSLGGTFTISIPPLAQLPVAPGTYYMRIISDCSNLAWNQNGTVIRITIGAPAAGLPTIIPSDQFGNALDTVFCSAELVLLSIQPVNFESKYQWASQSLNNGQPFTVDAPGALLIDFSGSPEGNYEFFVREINYGCYGAYGNNDIDIIPVPDVAINGPVQVCVGDTVTFAVDYLPETYYNWDAPNGVDLFDEANSQVTMIFNDTGTYTISNFSLNSCGGDSGTYNLKVVNLYNVSVGPDQTICEGTEVQISAESGFLDKVFTVKDTGSRGERGIMFDIIAHDDVVIDSFSCKFIRDVPVSFDIYAKQGTYKGFEQNIGAWNQIDGYANFSPPPGINVLPIPMSVPIQAGDTVGFYIVTTNILNPGDTANIAYVQDVGAPGSTYVYKTDGVIDYFVGSTVKDYFGLAVSPRVLTGRIYYHTKAGLYYSWNTGDTTETITASPNVGTGYSVIIFDTAGCRNRDTMFVQVNPKPAVNAGPDTLLCEGEFYNMPATSAATNLIWAPGAGLSSTTILNPDLSPLEKTTFVLQATDAGTGCIAYDTVEIDVKNCQSYINVPQAFTPNNDGVNDFFTLFGNNIESYELRIYNRWGELVYSTTNMGELNDLSQGWDGSYKGKVQNAGTFVYYLTAKDIYQKTTEKKGNITLIR